MEYLIVAIGLIVVWLIWSRISINKHIKEVLEVVDVDKPIKSHASKREVIGYCQRNNIECIPSREYLIIDCFNSDKTITVKQDGSDRTGDTIFFIQ